METKVYRVGIDLLATSPDLWTFVRDGLLTIKRRIGDRAKWEPMHVRASIANNNSELWIIYDNENQPKGFYILSLSNDPFINIPTTLWVWLAYADASTPNLIESHIEDVKARAKALGVDNIEMMSPRHGWMRRLEKHGFAVREIIYGLKV